MGKRLTRNPRDAVLGGVASGFADYFDIDPVIARLGFVLLTFLHGTGVIIYLICWVVMPVGSAPPRPAAGDAGGQPGSGAEGGADGSQEQGGAPSPTPADRFAQEVRQAGETVAGEVRQAGRRVQESFSRRRGGDATGQIVGGAILVGIGLIFLLPRLDLWFWPHWLNLWDFWPVILIVIGATMLLRSRSGTE